MKSVRERQIPYDFTHMWNLRNKTNEQGRKREGEGEREKEKTRNRLLTVENTVMATRGEGVEGWVKQVMGMKEDTCLR